MDSLGWHCSQESKLDIMIFITTSNSIFWGWILSGHQGPDDVLAVIVTKGLSTESTFLGIRKGIFEESSTVKHRGIVDWMLPWQQWNVISHHLHCLVGPIPSNHLTCYMLTDPKALWYVQLETELSAANQTLMRNICWQIQIFIWIYWQRHPAILCCWITPCDCKTVIAVLVQRRKDKKDGSTCCQETWN